jgi:hypothetical protein
MDLWNYIKVCGQLHASHFTLGKEPLVQLEKNLGVWMWWQREKSLTLPGTETTIQDISSCYTDGAITVQNENSSVTLDFRV